MGGVSRSVVNYSKYFENISYFYNAETGCLSVKLGEDILFELQSFSALILFNHSDLERIWLELHLSGISILQ